MSSKILSLIKLFVKLGFTAFGGPAAHVAMMEEEVVERRKWMTAEHFLDLMGATNLIPGPNSTEMVMHVGLHRAGILGMLAAGLSFIIPAAGLTLILAVFYVEYGSLPAVEPFLFGIKPAVLAIILAAVFKLGKKALKTNWYLIIGLAVVAAGLLGMNEVFAILGGGLTGMLGIRLVDKFYMNGLLILPFLSITKIGGDVKLMTLFLTFLKIGAILFGSGYVLVAYLDGELVDKLGWLTRQQLLDAIAAGQFTPGPVLTTATFVGYQMAGFGGAALATLGIFLPSFFFVAILHRIVPVLRKSPWTAAFLDAVNISAVGIMVAVLLQLGYQTMLSPFDWRGILIFALACAIQFGQKKFGPVWIVVMGSLVGYGLSFL